MSIPPVHANRHLYHLTHLDNLKGVLTHGLLSVNAQSQIGLNHTSIAAESIQARRAQMPVPSYPGTFIHDYVPLYFCMRSSMLLKVVKSKNVDQEYLVYFAFPISILSRQGVVFTNAAANTAIPPEFFTDPADLARLNWQAIDSPSWTFPDDRTKQARMAEVLVYHGLNPREASHLIAFDQDGANRVRQIYNEVGLPNPQIYFRDYHWFTNWDHRWAPEIRHTSITAGPLRTKKVYQEAVDYILANRGRALQPRFASLDTMLDALRSQGLLALPETAELINLQSANDVHKEDVGTHTLTVVRQLYSLPQFHALAPDEQRLVELAAYLHDIGKGPKSLWLGWGGGQRVDAAHPIRSVKMLQRILTEDVWIVEDRAVRVLCKLVCYHDLIGDILGEGKERDRQQLADIAENERDLDMLIAIGKADMSSISTSWDLDTDPLRDWVLGQL